MPIWKHHENHCGVYVVTDGTACKIGITNNGNTRLTTLQNGNPRRLTMHVFVRTSSMTEARRVEIAAHKALAAVHLHGEWFGVTPEIASDLVRGVVAGNHNAYNSAEAMTQRALKLLKKR